MFIHVLLYADDAAPAAKCLCNSLAMACPAFREDQLEQICCPSSYSGPWIHFNQQQSTHELIKLPLYIFKLHYLVCSNQHLTVRVKIRVCVLLYGSENWVTHLHRQRRLNTFHLCCLNSTLGINWSDRVLNPTIQQITGAPGFFSIENVSPTLERPRVQNWRRAIAKGYLYQAYTTKKTRRTNTIKLSLLRDVKCISFRCGLEENLER